VPPLAALRNTKQEEKINTCVFIQHSNETAIYYLEFLSSNENSWQHWRRFAGIWPILCECVWGLTENETFLWNYGMVELIEVCGGL